MVDIVKLKNIAADTFRHDIKVFNNVQWVPVTDAKASIGFAITDTLIAVKDEQENETASTSEVIDMVRNILDESEELGLQAEVIGHALESLKNDPTLTISQALELGRNEWIK